MLQRECSPVEKADVLAYLLSYPPALLPARSWKRVMGGLEQHYGSDATLDPKTLQQLDGWLQQHAGTSRRVAEEPPQDRVTRSAWFEREHRKVDAAVWKLPSVKSAAQCAACHGDVEQGRFDERGLRLMTTTTAPHTKAAAAPAAAPGRRIVDAPTRMFHALFALSFLGAYLTAEGERWRALHVTLGYTFAGLLLARVLYGLFGPRQAGLGLL